MYIKYISVYIVFFKKNCKRKEYIKCVFHKKKYTETKVLTSPLKASSRSFGYIG